MVYFADLETIDYFGADAEPVLRAVGWLERGRDYPVGEVSAEPYERLKKLLIKPFQPFVFAGPHACTLCGNNSETFGYLNLFVPAESFLYVAPEMILHYIAAHRYKPPEPFLDAVLKCPSTHTEQYQRAFLGSGGRVLTGAG